MFELLSSWRGSVTVNDVKYASIDEVSEINSKKFSDKVHIILHSNNKNQSESILDTESKELRITVRAYMTKKSTPEFDFMKTWNNDNPMPLRTMIGTIKKETRGMVYMNLHGDIYADRITTCMKCGRQLTNPVSQYFGIGPECGNHNYVNPFDSEEELKQAVDSYKKELQKITWSGWIIKSAIIESEEI